MSRLAGPPAARPLPIVTNRAVPMEPPMAIVEHVGFRVVVEDLPHYQFGRLGHSSRPAVGPPSSSSQDPLPSCMYVGCRTGQGEVERIQVNNPAIGCISAMSPVLRRIVDRNLEIKYSASALGLISSGSLPRRHDCRSICILPWLPWLPWL